MSFADGIVFAQNPTLNGVIWFVLLTLFLYFARQPAHRAILSLSRVAYQGMRMASSSLARADANLALRNREVLLAAGREACERMVEREFERVDAAIRRDLVDCPSVHRRIREEINDIETDHRESIEVPPPPPGWVKAVTAVAAIPTKGDPMVSNILEDIHGSLIKAQDKATEQYRVSSHERHEHLKSMVPHWRNLVQLVETADKKVAKLLERGQAIDHQIAEYEGILNDTDNAYRRLSSSSLVQFFISAMVMAVAVAGVMINFHLIARPMAEMVGGNSLVGGIKISDFAALVIILIEIFMGLFLMESLRITRLFPVISALPDTTRIRMVWTTLLILTLLASIESGLAYMREILLEDDLATSAVLRGSVESTMNDGFAWITTSAQMGMGFILPFALVFVAIPLENFIQSLRTVLGLAAGAILRSLSLIFRVIGSVSRHGGETLVEIYDIFVFAPLWLERQIKGGKGKGQKFAAVKASQNTPA